MPLDVLGRTRATLMRSDCFTLLGEARQSSQAASRWRALIGAFIGLKRGTPSMHESLARVDDVLAPCRHRQSLTRFRHSKD